MNDILRLILILVVFHTTAANAGVMNFDIGETAGVSEVILASFTQDGLTLTPLDTGSPLVDSHWDRMRDRSGATNSDNSARIHQGNNAEEIEFTFDLGSFDLLSIDIEAFELSSNNGGAGIIGVLTASSGATIDVSALGTIDLSSLPGWSNLSHFRFSAPLGVGDCTVAGTDCSGIVFDNISFQASAASVPEPTTLGLMGAGLLGLGFMRRRALLRKTRH